MVAVDLDVAMGLIYRVLNEGTPSEETRKLMQRVLQSYQSGVAHTPGQSAVVDWPIPFTLASAGQEQEPIPCYSQEQVTMIVEKCLTAFVDRGAMDLDIDQPVEETVEAHKKRAIGLAWCIRELRKLVRRQNTKIAILNHCVAES